MTWVKLDDNFAEDPRLEAAGTEALALHVAALCYCGRNLTDGRLTEGTARRLWALKKPDAAVQALLRKGLWTKTNGGFEIVDYLQHQPSKDQVEEKRRQSADRQARARARRAVSNGDSHASSHGVTHSAPTRPDPTRPEGSGERSGAHASGTPPTIPAPRLCRTCHRTEQAHHHAATTSGDAHPFETEDRP